MSNSNKVLRVTSRSEGFRRAGIVFGTVSQDLPLADLSEEQRAAIINEPNLVSLEVDTSAQASDPISQEATAAASPAPVKPAVTPPRAAQTTKAKPAVKTKATTGAKSAGKKSA